MTTKTLNTIQTVSKIGRIISKIILILSIVGGAGCLVGIISLAVIPGGGFQLGGVSIHGLIEENAGISMSTAYTAMAVGMIFCAGEAVLCKFAENYFKHELEAGTPFTFDGAKEMLRLGILTICVPIGTMIIAGIIYGIMTAVFGNVGDLDFDNNISVGLGIMFIITSLICKYGAELTQNQGQFGEATK